MPHGEQVVGRAPRGVADGEGEMPRLGDVVVEVELTLRLHCALLHGRHMLIATPDELERAPGRGVVIHTQQCASRSGRSLGLSLSATLGPSASFDLACLHPGILNARPLRPERHTTALFVVPDMRLLGHSRAPWPRIVNL